MDHQVVNYMDKPFLPHDMFSDWQTYITQPLRSFSFVYMQLKMGKMKKENEHVFQVRSISILFRRNTDHYLL